MFKFKLLYLLNAIFVSQTMAQRRTKQALLENYADNSQTMEESTWHEIYGYRDQNHYVAAFN